MNPRELLGILNGMGAEVKNHMSLIDEQYVMQVRKMYADSPRTVTVRPTTMAVAPSPAVKEPEPSPKPKAVPVPATTQVAAPTPAPAPVASTPVQADKTAKPRTGRANEQKPSQRPKAETRPAKSQRPPKDMGSTPKQDTAAVRGTAKRGGQGKRGPRGNASPNSPSAAPRDRRARWREPVSEGRTQRRAPRGRGRSAVKKVIPPVKRTLELPPAITVKNLAGAMAQPVGEVIKKLMGLGVLATINQDIDYETAAIVAQEFGNEVHPAPSLEDKLRVAEPGENPEALMPRPPVVTVMGHVDHGKTSLLDAIKESNVTAQEAGGITQHIGAYQVEIGGRRITFLDTPGHEAFTAMRARGAQVTDIAVLVVAADDGVMPQTIEAINHAKAANISIIVAINKIDKAQANAERVKQELTEYGLVPEEWGGETIVAEVSALKRTGLDHLLEMILLASDMKECKADPNRPAKGTIIEAQLDKGQGPVATVLIQNGTLELGDTVIAGSIVGRVRALINDKGKRVKKAGPSIPVEVVGMNGVPMAGDELFAIKDEHLARQVADQRQQLKRENDLRKTQPLTLDDLFNRVKEGELKELRVIVKADVHGSVEALRQSLERIANEQVRVGVIHGGVGAITETDVMLASASDAIIIGFNVRPDPAAKRLAEREHVDIRLYRIIYNAIEDIEAALEGMLAPEYEEVVLGRAEVRTVFKVPKVGNVAGCYVLEGKITRSADVRVIRDHVVIHEGKLGSLKRFKDDVREVLGGFECGIGLERFNDVKEGDVIEAFAMEEVKKGSRK